MIKHIDEGFGYCLRLSSLWILTGTFTCLASWSINKRAIKNVPANKAANAKMENSEINVANI